MMKIDSASLVTRMIAKVGQAFTKTILIVSKVQYDDITTSF